MTLESWALQWGVPFAALQDLRVRLGTLQESFTPALDAPGHTEAYVQSVVRLEAARKGCILWRNNTGALKDERGIPVRYGLGNDTPKVNKVFKMGDLVGIRPLLIEPIHVGCIVGQFLMREIKRPGWRGVCDDHEKAQENAISLVTSMGGDAAFATGEGTILDASVNRG